MSRRTFWRLQLLIWTTYAVVRFLALLPAIQSDERAMLGFMQVVRAGTGFIVTSILGVLIERQLAARAQRRLLLGVAFVAAVFAWVFSDRVLLVALAPIVGGDIPWQSVPRGFELEYLFVLLAWTGGAIGIVQAEQARRLRDAVLRQQLEKQAANLEALVAQLNPHFLFNTLNMIRGLIAEQPTLAREMLTRLSVLLRRILEISPTSQIPLREEFDLLGDYVHIQKARFEDALEVDVQLPDAASGMLVPPLILQPLVENAIKYGQPSGRGIRRITVQATLDAGGLRLDVRNQGQLRDAIRPGALGLDLTRRRLHAVYADAAHVDLLETDGSVTASIRIERPNSGVRVD